jgi:hypothetical protein
MSNIVPPRFKLATNSRAIQVGKVREILEKANEHILAKQLKALGKCVELGSLPGGQAVTTLGSALVSSDLVDVSQFVDNSSPEW